MQQWWQTNLCCAFRALNKCSIIHSSGSVSDSESVSHTFCNESYIMVYWVLFGIKVALLINIVFVFHVCNPFLCSSQLQTGRLQWPNGAAGAWQEVTSNLVAAVPLSGHDGGVATVQCPDQGGPERWPNPSPTGHVRDRDAVDGQVHRCSGPQSDARVQWPTILRLRAHVGGRRGRRFQQQQSWGVFEQQGPHDGEPRCWRRFRITVTVPVLVRQPVFCCTPGIPEAQGSTAAERHVSLQLAWTGTRSADGPRRECEISRGTELIAFSASDWLEQQQHENNNILSHLLVC